MHFKYAVFAHQIRRVCLAVGHRRRCPSRLPAAPPAVECGYACALRSGPPPVTQRLPFRLGSPVPRLQTVRAVMTGFGLCAGVDCCAPCRNWGCVLAWTIARHAVIDAMGRRMQTKRRGCAVINAASSPMLICRDLRPVSPSCDRRYTYLTKLSVLAMMPADLQGVSPYTIKSLHNQVPASCH